MLVIVLAVAVVKAVAEPLATTLSTYSPQLPAVALSLVAVPTMAGLIIVGVVKVLLVSVSVVALPTRVSAPFGRINDPEAEAVGTNVTAPLDEPATTICPAV